MRPRIAVIQFPGVNCEYETRAALAKAGLDAVVVRWNQPVAMLEAFDGFVLPGGFSYQDRVRAGAIAAADEIIEVLMKQAGRGRPVVGICNGAQVLVEAGLVPGLEGGAIDLALAPNRGMGRDGYYANWVFIRVTEDTARCAVTCCLEPGEVLPIPIAHAEGRFTSSAEGIFDRLEEAGQIVFKYCRADGSPAAAFPDDPNGSERLAAGLANPAGNVVAMMPHPERGTWLRQVPGELASPWSSRRLAATGSWAGLEEDGPSARMFRSIRSYIEERL
ncbi:MAG: phosphoribosylformylglycinamidine synthase I [bacterium]